MKKESIRTTLRLRNAGGINTILNIPAAREEGRLLRLHGKSVESSMRASLLARPCRSPRTTTGSPTALPTYPPTHAHDEQFRQERTHCLPPLAQHPAHACHTYAAGACGYLLPHSLQHQLLTPPPALLSCWDIAGPRLATRTDVGGWAGCSAPLTSCRYGRGQPHYTSLGQWGRDCAPHPHPPTWHALLHLPARTIPTVNGGGWGTI